MQVNQLFIQLSSDDPQRLGAFYRDVVGLPEVENMGENMFQAGPGTLVITPHDGTRGPAKEPSRIFFDLWVDDPKAERERMEKQGVQFSRKEGLEWWGGVYSTFTDPDGNIVQVVGYRPDLATEPPA